MTYCYDSKYQMQMEKVSHNALTLINFTANKEKVERGRLYLSGILYQFCTMPFICLLSLPLGVIWFG